MFSFLYSSAAVLHNFIFSATESLITFHNEPGFTSTVRL